MNSNKYCTLCKEEDINDLAICECIECNKYLCEDHMKIHKKKTQFHTLQYLSFSYNQNNNHSNNSSQQHHYCKEHSDQILEMKCLTCQSLICLECAFHKHKEHDYILIQDCIQKDKLEYLNYFNDNNLIDRIKEKQLENKKKVEQNILEIKEEAELLINKEINETFEIWKK
ncbi:hypothetical protein ABK040_007711 [Willaertia magna]